MYRLDCCPEGRFELAQMRPRHDLLDHVTRYAGYREHQGPIAMREVAGTVVPLILGFGTPFRIGLGTGHPEDRQSFTAGLHDGYADIVSLGGAHCVQIDFTPLGAHRFFAMPMRDLASRTVLLDDIGGFGDLAGRLHDAPGWAARFALVDRYVRARFAATPPPSATVAWAWQQLVASDGAIRIGTLAREIGWSRKHLAGRFAAEVGITPKTAGRILRFAATRRAITTASRRVDWAVLAAERGYADQAHLIREFRALSGVTPVAYVNELAGRFQGEVTKLQDERPSQL